MRPEAANDACRAYSNRLAAMRSEARTTGMALFDCPLPLADPVLSRLPSLFRVESICRLPVDDDRHVARAELFHTQAALSVFWVGGRRDTNILKDSLVSIRWLGGPACCDGALRIAGLVESDRPEESFNLFDTVPYGWVANRSFLKEATAHWRQASRSARRLFNVRHWNAESLRSYLAACGALGTDHRFA